MTITDFSTEGLAHRFNTLQDGKDREITLYFYRLSILNKLIGVPWCFGIQDYFRRNSDKYHTKIAAMNSLKKQELPEDLKSFYYILNAKKVYLVDVINKLEEEERTQTFSLMLEISFTNYKNIPGIWPFSSF